METIEDSHKVWEGEFYIIEALIDNSLWDKKTINYFQKYLHQVLNEISIKSNAINFKKKITISILFSGDKKIIELNTAFGKTNKATNVLSFPSFTENNDEIFLGDIVFSIQTIRKEAKKINNSVNKHLIHLFIHGVLHLLGYDHKTNNEAQIMETLEIKVLQCLNIDNPYQKIN